MFFTRIIEMLSDQMQTSAVVILGGTFDPFHIGHRAILTQVMELLDIPTGWVIPLNSPGHRHEPVASPRDRLAMATIGVRDLPGVQVQDLEVIRGGVTFTIDTAKEIARKYPQLTQWYIVGADEARTLPEWHKWPLLLEFAKVAIVNRTGKDPISRAECAALGIPATHMELLTVASPPISATTLRNALCDADENHLVQTYLAPGVLAYIQEHHLYGEQPH